MRKNPISIRPHHFLCMLTYVGKGYSRNFVANFDSLIDKINSGQYDFIIVDGVDDICAPRLCDKDDTTCHCHDDSIRERDKQALNALGFSVGDSIPITKDLIARLRADYKDNTIRAACSGCEWKELCDNIAEKNFEGTKLK